MLFQHFFHKMLHNWDKMAAIIVVVVEVLSFLVLDEPPGGIHNSVLELLMLVRDGS